MNFSVTVQELLWAVVQRERHIVPRLGEFVLREAEGVALDNFFSEGLGGGIGGFDGR
jgi:hypothetical protein